MKLKIIIKKESPLRNNRVLNYGMDSSVPSQAYEAADAEFEKIIEQAFYFERLNCPLWSKEIEDEKSKQANLNQQLVTLAASCEAAREELAKCNDEIEKNVAEQTLIENNIKVQDTAFVDRWNGAMLPAWLPDGIKSLMSIIGYFLFGWSSGITRNEQDRKFPQIFMCLFAGVLVVAGAYFLTRNSVWKLSEDKQVYLEYRGFANGKDYGPDPYIYLSEVQKLDLLRSFVTQYENEMQAKHVNLSSVSGTTNSSNESRTCVNALLSTSKLGERFKNFANVTAAIYKRQVPLLPKLQNPLIVGEADIEKQVRDKLSLKDGNEVQGEYGVCISMLHELWTARLKLASFPISSENNSEIEKLFRKSMFYIDILMVKIANYSAMLIWKMTMHVIRC